MVAPDPINRDRPPERPTLPEDRVVRAIPVGTDYQKDDVVDLSVFWRYVRRHWLMLLLVALGGGAAGWAISYLFDKQYKVETLFALVEDQGGSGGGLSSFADKFGGIASLAGLDLSSSDRERGANVALLKAHVFIEQFIAQQNMLPDLFPNRWDAKAGRWREGYMVPTVQEGGNVFIKRALTINEDKKTGVVTLRIEWTGREKLAGWANGLVALANSLNRDRAIRDATQSIEYLEREAEHADTVEIKQSIYSLLESQMNKRMVATTRPEFTFRVIDPAETPRVRELASPNRPGVAVVVSLLALIIACVVGLNRQKRRAD
jgi:hypothetical protein